jgi:Holliday junction resolvasome RuvABC endonuclease subunit
MDPSLRNWGIATGIYDTETRELIITAIDVIQPVLSKAKQVRQNSLDIDASKQLFAAAYRYAQGTQAVFAEIPVGSQSSRAMASYGVCTGVIGSLKGMSIPIIEVNPTEVKLAAVGNKTATKEQMIAWATSKHPEANWPRYNQNGKSIISEAKAEHMADAIGSIYAGIASTTFQQLLSLKAYYAN